MGQIISEFWYRETGWTNEICLVPGQLNITCKCRKVRL